MSKIVLSCYPLVGDEYILLNNEKIIRDPNLINQFKGLNSGANEKLILQQQNYEPEFAIAGKVQVCYYSNNPINPGMIRKAENDLSAEQSNILESLKTYLNDNV